MFGERSMDSCSPEYVVREIEEDDALLGIEETLGIQQEGDESEEGGEVAQHGPHRQPDFSKMFVLLGKKKKILIYHFIYYGIPKTTCYLTHFP
jgi:hypothetical protein